MMTAKVSKTCWSLIMCDKTYFIHMHLLVLLHMFKYSFNAWIWNTLSYYTEFQQNSMNGLDADYGWPWPSK
jgi:hypothetical protein